MPHLDRIQTSFGRHDLTDVQASVGGEARAANQQLGSLAYARGRQIAFKESPDLRLAAHEAAHVVQQARGVRLKDGIGRPGDPYELQADRAADHVVAGKSAEALLDDGARSRRSGEMSGRGAGGDVQAQVDAGPDAGTGDAGPVDAGGQAATQTTVFNGETLSDDPTYTYDFLKRMFMTQGYEAMRDFVFSFESQIVAAKRPAAGISDDPEYLRDSAISTTLRAQYENLTADRNSFIESFETHARSVAGDLLNDSQERVLAEAVRYGVGNLHIEFSWLGIPEIKGDTTDNASTRGIALAAQGLLDRKTKAENAVKEFQDYSSGLPAIVDLGSSRFHSGEDRVAAFHAKIERTQRDLDVYRIQVQMRYPLLAALSSDDDFKRGDLEDLAKGEKGKSGEASDVIVKQVVEKLENIAKVRQELKPGGDINIWLVRKLVAATREELAVEPGTLHAYIVDTKVEEEQPSQLTGILIGLVQLGLVLLAPFTEGLTLIPAAALSVHTAYEHFVEYETQSALHRTDFGAAALSAEEPSLFWLAVDIVGAGFDVGAAGGAALRIFRELAPVARTIRGAEVSEDALRNFERQAGELGGKKLAENVARDARALRGVSEEAGITAEEARKFEQVAKDVAKEVTEEELSGVAKSADTLAGGKATVSRSGGVWSCQSPCVMMRERFKNLLAREEKYAKSLNNLEERARFASTLPEGPEVERLQQEIANEAAALEREMRTTALPGDWTPPPSVTEAPDYKDLVKRRGSIAAELDHHPPDWTGKEEARFRYGLPKGEEAEAGYRWTLDGNGELRYERMDQRLSQRRFNPATGEFEEAAEEGLITAKRGPEEIHERAKLPKTTNEEMDAAFKRRRTLIAERDRLEALEEAGDLKPDEMQKLKQKLSKLYGDINEQSRQLGEEAAEGVMSGKGKKLYPLGKTHSTSGDFDQVWKVGDEFHIVEAKGGSGGLGSRAVGAGMRAEQGTLEYATSIAQNMAKNGATKEIRRLGNELIKALGEGKVKYILVRAPIGTEAGEAALRNVKVTEFLIPPG